MATAILWGFLCKDMNHVRMYIFICLFIYSFHRHFLWGWEMDSSLPGLMAWKGRTGMIMKAFKKMLCVQVYMSSEQIEVACLLILSLSVCSLSPLGGIPNSCFLIAAMSQGHHVLNWEVRPSTNSLFLKVAKWQCVPC